VRFGILTRYPQDPHTVLYLRGNAVIAKYRPRITQTNRLTLHDEAPQRIARIMYQLIAADRIARSLLVLGERQKRGFQRPSQPTERGRLLLHDFVVERRGARCP
jgi:hypothetical protein